MTKPVKRAGNPNQPVVRPRQVSVTASKRAVATKFIPSVKAPRVYKGTLDRIVVPQGVRTSYRKRFDWNSDGYVQGSYERYQLWSLVVRLFTKYQKLRTSAKYARDPALRRRVMRLKKDLRVLFKMYKHLPQVNIKRKTVRIGKRVIPIHSKSKKLSSSILFAYGEAFSAVPRSIRPLLFEYGKGFGSLKLHVKKYRLQKGYLHKGRYYFFKQSGGYSVARSISVLVHRFTKRIHSISELNVRRRISTINSGFDVYKRIFSLKHEIGHAIEHLIGYYKQKDKQCVFKVNSNKGYLSCRKVFFAQVKLSGRQISRSLAFMKVWLGKLRKAGVTAKMVRQFDKGSHVASPKQRRLIRKYLFRLHAASGPSEFLADSWAAFTTFRSPWTIKDKKMSSRKDLKRVSTFYFDLFSRLSWGGLRAVTDIIGK